MAINKPTLEAEEYHRFLKEYYNGTTYTNQRLGEALYNYLKLHKVTDQSSLLNIYEKTGEEALNTIRNLFDLM